MISYHKSKPKHISCKQNNREKQTIHHIAFILHMFDSHTFVNSPADSLDNYYFMHSFHSHSLCLIKKITFMATLHLTVSSPASFSWLRDPSSYCEKKPELNVYDANAEREELTVRKATPATITCI